MTTERVPLFQAFANLISFYPKMSAAIAFGTMVAAGRMMTIPSAGDGVAQIAHDAVKPAIAHDAVAKPARANPAPRKKRRSDARKSRRMLSRRKAA
jgi:DNA-binding transcriptional regulator YdaS (Cro superfamily)